MNKKAENYERKPGMTNGDQRIDEPGSGKILLCRNPELTLVLTCVLTCGFLLPLYAE